MNAQLYKKMRDIISQFPAQFNFEPVIINKRPEKEYERFIVCGMGGSHLAGDLLLRSKLDSRLFIHVDYGLPPFSDELLHRSLIIISSYSGNTEETLDSLEHALNLNLDVLIIASGGKLLEIAQKKNLPYIKLPSEPKIPPRHAVGYSFRALLKAMNNKKLMKEADTLAEKLDPKSAEKIGKSLANKVRGHIPIMYSSHKNSGISYCWKIKLCETGKVPAFYNIFPELNHNEMNCFARKGLTKELADRFYFFFLYDEEDDDRIQERMRISKKLYSNAFKTEYVKIKDGQDLIEIFQVLLIADWFSFYTAVLNEVDPEETTILEQFKTLIT